MEAFIDFVSICSWCAAEGKIKEPTGVQITHGICQRHAAEMLREAGMRHSEEELDRMVDAVRKDFKVSECPHTPLPWVVGASGVTVFDEHGVKRIVSQDTNIPSKERAANAEFIVRACNNFDALLAAQKELIKELYLIDSYSMTPAATWEILVRGMADKAKKLVANAERRPS